MHRATVRHQRAAFDRWSDRRIDYLLATQGRVSPSALAWLHFGLPRYLIEWARDALAARDDLACTVRPDGGRIYTKRDRP
ncbi:MAG: hypothetical protein F4057_09565 [Acidobacteria bacterium]|nr:hypothetical protein [Acidobacteriota bacterium]